MSITRRDVLAMAAGSAVGGGANLAASEDAQAQGKSGTSTPRIDVHYHVFPRDLPPGKMLTRLNQIPGAKNWDPARAADILGAQGIATAVLSLPGHEHFPDYEGDVLRQAVRKSNDGFAKLRQDNKGLFGLFANLPPLYDVDGALAEITYGLDTLKAEGVTIVTNYKDGAQERWLGDPKFVPVFEELNRRRAVVYVHPMLACMCAAPPHQSLELPFDTARTTFSLWQSGAFERWPNIRFIFCHGGGPVPMLLARFNGLGRPGPNGTVLRDADVQIGRQWFDTAQATGVAAIAALLKFADRGRILFGSDTPMAPPASQQAMALATALNDKGLARAIEYDNAVALMPSLKHS